MPHAYVGTLANACTCTNKTETHMHDVTEEQAFYTAPLPDNSVDLSVDLSKIIWEEA